MGELIVQKYRKTQGEKEKENLTYLVYIIRHIGKPRLLQPPRNPRGHIHRLAKLRTRPIEPHLPIHDRLGRLMRPIIRQHPRLKLLRLEPAPGLEMRKHLLQQPGPVANTAAHTAGVDVVERLGWGERPVALGVVDEEAAVGGRPAGLDGAEVCAKDVGVREVFGHVEGPFTGAGADVEDAAARGVWDVGQVDWGAVEIAAAEQFEEVVHQGEAVLFLLVVGEWVLPVAVGVVATAILVAVVSDGAGEGEVGADEGLGVEEGVVVACLGEMY